MIFILTILFGQISKNVGRKGFLIWGQAGLFVIMSVLGILNFALEREETVDHEI